MVGTPDDRDRGDLGDAPRARDGRALLGGEQSSSRPRTSRARAPPRRPTATTTHASSAASPSPAQILGQPRAPAARGRRGSDARRAACKRAENYRDLAHQFLSVPQQARDADRDGRLSAVPPRQAAAEAVNLADAQDGRRIPSKTRTSAPACSSVTRLALFFVRLLSGPRSRPAGPIRLAAVPPRHDRGGGAAAEQRARMSRSASAGARRWRRLRRPGRRRGDQRGEGLELGDRDEARGAGHRSRDRGRSESRVEIDENRPQGTLRATRKPFGANAVGGGP